MGSQKDELRTGIAEGRIEDSSRVDWFSGSYFAASLPVQREQIRFFLELLYRLSGTYVMAEGGGRRFFEESWYHQAGIAIKWTEPDGNGVNKGLLSADIRGDAWAALPASLRKAVLLDLRDIEGFKQCTRLDVQRTVVSPHATAEEIHAKLLRKEVWVPGFSGYRQQARVNADGHPIKGCTIDWGTPKGLTNASTYNKRAEVGIEGPPAVRHELRLRKQAARDRYDALAEALDRERVETGTRVEDVFVKQCLEQSMTYKDTSRLKDIPRDQWPKNWASNSNPADFWREVVTGETGDFTTKWRYDTTLENLVRNRAKQYGRGRSKWVLLRLFRDGESLQDVIQDDLDLDFVRLRNEDIDEVLEQVPDERKEECLEWARDSRAIAARNVEEGPR